MEISTQAGQPVQHVAADAARTQSDFADVGSRLAGAAASGTTAVGAQARASESPRSRPATTFALRIGFNGLCLFVYDPDSGSMFVLMPKTPGMPSDEVHEAHLSIGGKRPALRDVDFQGVQIVNPGSASEELPGVFDLTAFSGGRIARNFLDNPLDPKDPNLQARVKLPAGCVVEYIEGARWEHMGASPWGDYITSQLVWEMEVDGDSIAIAALTGNRQDVGVLQPVNGTLDVCMTNLPRDMRAAKTEHFAYYHALVPAFNAFPRNPEDEHPAPIHTPCWRPDEPEFAFPVHTEGNLLTCMVARAQA